MNDWRMQVRNPKTWVLGSIGIFSFMMVVWFSSALVPLFAALIVGYLLDPLVDRLVKLGVYRILSVAFVMIGSVLLIALIIFAILPTVVEQLNQLANQLPELISKVEMWVAGAQAKLPDYISSENFQGFLDRLQIQLESLLGGLITVLLAVAGGTIGGIVNAVIVGFMVFFLLKDKEAIWAYLLRVFTFLRNETVMAVLADIDRQMGKFIKGKFIVVFLLFILSTIVFWIYGLDFFLLLGIMTGLSTFIPYVGATVVGVPVVIAGFIQWGTFGKALLTFVVYTVIQIVDGNYMTPVIIGRETNIHPVAIILAILICGTLWGFWGVVFAVPVAVVVKSVFDVLYFPSLEQASSHDEAEAGM